MIHTARVTEFYPGGGHDRVEIIVDSGDACVLAIADGMGGRSGAAAAAEFWIAAVRNQAADQDAWSDAKFWLRVMADADRVIRDAAHAGETTAVVAAISGAGVVGASVGDSGAWLVRGETYDDLTRAQIRKPGLGTGMAMPIPFHHKGSFDGTLLLATDGLLKYTTPQAICRCVTGQGDLDALPGSLIDLVRMRSGGLQDDVAVAVCRCEQWRKPGRLDQRSPGTHR